MHSNKRSFEIFSNLVLCCTTNIHEHGSYNYRASIAIDFNDEPGNNSTTRHYRRFSFAFPVSMANRTFTIIPVKHSPGFYPYMSLVYLPKSQISAAPSLNAYRLVLR